MFFSKTESTSAFFRLQYRYATNFSARVIIMTSNCYLTTRYLLNTKKISDLPIKMDESLIPECIEKLATSDTWQTYQSEFISQLEFTRRELKDLSNKHGDETIDDMESIDKLRKKVTALFDDLEKLKKREKAIAELNQFMQNEDLQLKMILEDELKEHFPEFLPLEQKTSEEHQAIQSEINNLMNRTDATTPLTEDETQQLKQLDEQNKKLNSRITVWKNNLSPSERIHFNDLNTLLVNIRKSEASRLGHHISDPEIETLENITDTGTSIEEVAISTQAYMQNIDELEATYQVSDSLGPVTSILYGVPLVNDFFRGLSYLKDAYHAYQHPETGQRNTKLFAGVFGGLVSLGCLIVSALLLGGVGALGTAAAAFAAPITVAAAAAGVCAVTLYRNYYMLRQINHHLELIQAKLIEVDKQIGITEESLKGKSVGSDPRMIRLQLLKDKLHTEISILAPARDLARKHVRLSAASLVGFTLAVAALCSTGIGALVVASAASILLITVSVIRIHEILKQRKEKKKKSIVIPPKQVELPAVDNHTSDLMFGRKLLQEHQLDNRKVAETIINSSVGVEVAAQIESHAEAAKVTHAPQSTPTPKDKLSDDDTETEAEKGGIHKKIT